MRYILIFITAGLFLGSCSKENQRDCWQGWNPAGIDLPGLVLCDKTRAEAEAEFPGYWFYRDGETKYCWRSVTNGNTLYWVNMPESMKEKYVSAGYYTNFTKIDCSSFCHCTWHEKHKSKITGFYGLTYSILETLLSADTCSKLSVGRVIIYRETPDSLITRELREIMP